MTLILLPQTKRARTAPPGPTSVRRLHSTLSLDDLPDPILACVRECLPVDLQALRVTNWRLRNLVDSDHYLDVAIARSGLPTSLEVCMEFPQETSYLPTSLKPINFVDNWAFKLMLSGGYCTACGKYAGGLPLSSNLRIRLCGEYDCLARICSDEFTAPDWSMAFPNDHAYHALNCAHIPYMNDFDNINQCAVRPNNDQCMSYRSRYLRKELDQDLDQFPETMAYWDDKRRLRNALQP
ncbi:hypothetical protein HDZ31DRAFT_77609, partial [Schizophyllum fasciatum]